MVAEMSKTTRHTATVNATVNRIHRLPSSKMGNPRFVVHVTLPDGSPRAMATRANAMMAYAIGPHLIGQRVTVTASWTEARERLRLDAITQA